MATRCAELGPWSFRIVAKKIGVLVSGSGSNLQAILEAARSGKINHGEVAVVVSSHPGVKALDRAKSFGVAALVVDPKLFKDRPSHAQELVRVLDSHKVDLVCLAGYILKLEPEFVKHFRNRILNVHPALLPKFGGKGMYGIHVHKAVLSAGEKESGVTVHWVDEEYDHGPHILQRRVPVEPNDTPETLAARVLALEHKVYPEAIEKVLLEKEVLK